MKSPEQGLNPEGKSIEVEKTEVLRNEYKNLMGDYQRLYREIIKLERKHPLERRDEAVQWEILEIDKERNQIHQKLNRIAEQVGRTKEDVIVDMVRWQKSLKEFGLPEFSVLDSGDMIESFGSTYFNIALQLDRPQFHEKRETVLGEPFLKGSEDEEKHSKPVIADDELLIVFSINTILPKFGYPRGYGMLEEKKPFDYDERIARAKNLAKKTNGKFFINTQGSHHESDANVMGVVIPKKNLEKVAGVIRNDPEKFRLGEQFYTDSTLQELRTKKKEEDIQREKELQEDEKLWRKDFNKEYPHFAEQCNEIESSFGSLSLWVDNLRAITDNPSTKSVLQNYEELRKKYRNLKTAIDEYRSGRKSWYNLALDEGNPPANYFSANIREMEWMLAELSKDKEIELLQEKAKRLKDWRTKAEFKNLASKFSVKKGDIMTALNKLQKSHPEWTDNRLEPNGDIVNVYSPEFFDALIKQLETK